MRPLTPSPSFYLPFLHYSFTLRSVTAYQKVKKEKKEKKRKEKKDKRRLYTIQYDYLEKRIEAVQQTIKGICPDQS
jgi:hypothetical protein